MTIPTMTYSDLANEVAVHVDGSYIGDWLVARTRDAVIRVSEDLQFFRLERTVPRNADRENLSYVLEHRGMDFGQHVLVWGDEREASRLFPPDVISKTILRGETTEVVFAAHMTNAPFANEYVFEFDVVPSRQGDDFPRDLYDREHELIITKALSLIPKSQRRDQPGVDHYGQYMLMMPKRASRYHRPLNDLPIGMHTRERY